MNRFNNFTATAVQVALLLLLLSSCKKSHDVVAANPEPVTYKNKIVYIYKSDSTDAVAYKTLLQANHCGVTLFDMAQIGNIDFKKFDLLVIGGNTSQDAYDFAAVVGSFKSSGKPVLMIAEGGGHFGEMINSAVNWSTTATFTLPASCIVVDSTQSLYKTPKTIKVPANLQLPLFNNGTTAEAFYKAPYNNYANVEVIEQGSSSSSVYFSVTFESGKYGYFGYKGNVNEMTTTGRDFMVNLTYYIGKLTY